MPQLVGVSCAICRERISNELESRFCRACGHPRHDVCARPPERPAFILCAACGAPVDPAELPSLFGPFPVAKVCPKCNSSNYKRVKPMAQLAYTWDRVCRVCGTRYVPPTPRWAPAIFVGVGLLLVGPALVFAVWALVRRKSPLCALLMLLWVASTMGAVPRVHGVRTFTRPGKV
jgi:hypothetical protein